MVNIEHFRASNTLKLREAQRLRWRVYGKEEQLLHFKHCHWGREVDSRDEAPSTVHFLATSETEPVGTIRLELGSTRGLALSSCYALEGFYRTGIKLAEVSRFCVRRRFRGSGAARLLLNAVTEYSERCGVSHCVVAGNTQTDCPEDAALLERLFRARGSASKEFSVNCLRPGPQPSATTRRVFSAADHQRAKQDDLQGLKLPNVLSLFAQKLAARSIGPTHYDEYFGVFAMPLVIDVGEVAQRLRSFNGAVRQNDRRATPLPAPRSA